MFEALGVCRELAKKMRDDAAKLRAETRANIEGETYLDTKDVTPRKLKERRASWRVRIKEMTLEDYKKELDTEVLDVQEFRRRQLLMRYPCATFETLDGRRFSEFEHSYSRKLRQTTLRDTDEGAWYSSRFESRQSRV
jgi:hypothetical protein